MLQQEGSLEASVATLEMALTVETAVTVAAVVTVTAAAARKAGVAWEEQVEVVPRRSNLRKHNRGSRTRRRFSVGESVRR